MNLWRLYGSMRTVHRRELRAGAEPRRLQLQRQRGPLLVARPARASRRARGAHRVCGDLHGRPCNDGRSWWGRHGPRRRHRRLWAPRRLRARQGHPLRRPRAAQPVGPVQARQRVVRHAHVPAALASPGHALSCASPSDTAAAASLLTVSSFSSLLFVFIRACGQVPFAAFRADGL